jgi:hypothetical protein
MPDASAQEWLPRYQMQLPFVHRARTPNPGRVEIGWTRNLSEGGACVEVGGVLQPRMPLRFLLRTDRGAIDGEAKVVWTGASGPAKGGVLHGIAFTRLAPNQLRALTDLLRFRGPMRDGGFRFPLDLTVTCHPRGPASPPLQGRVGDLNREGLLLQLGQSLLPGTPLDLILHTARGLVAVEGEIVWMQPPERRAPGEPICHGVRFASASWNLSLALGLLLVVPLEGLPSDRLIAREVSSRPHKLPNWVGQASAARPAPFATLRPDLRDR